MASSASGGDGDDSLPGWPRLLTQKSYSPMVWSDDFLSFINLSGNDLMEACEKSRAAWIHVASQITRGPIIRSDQQDHHPHHPHHLQQEDDGCNTDGSQQVHYRSLFVVDSSNPFWSMAGTAVPCTREVGRQAEWGSRDVMIDFRESTHEQRMESLQAAADFSWEAVTLLGLRLDAGEQKAWLEALSLSAAGPKSLLISDCSFPVYDLLTALDTSKCCTKGGPLSHLSLHYFRDQMSDLECVELLARLASLTSLELLFLDDISPEFVGRLAELHPSHSALPASLQRLRIDNCADFLKIWSRAAPAFMNHWPQLKHLTLLSSSGDDWMSEDDLITTMQHYLAAVPSGSSSLNRIKARGYHQGKINVAAPGPPEHGSTSPAAMATQLHRLTIGWFQRTNKGRQSSRQAVAAVVDALSKSGLPSLELVGISKDLDPAIKAQLLRNRRLLELGDLERVPATSIRLYICGDPYAGKTTLLSTLHSIYSQKRRDCLNIACCGLGYVRPPERTQGIEVRAITSGSIRISLWDMAGQEEFHAFHDYMFPDISTASSNQPPSLFMFVWSPIRRNNYATSRKTGQDFDISFRYWLKFLASKSRKSNTTLQVIVVFTHADQLKLIKDAVARELESLRQQFKGIIDILVNGTFEVDARNMKSVKGVGEYSFEIARELLQGAEMYDICKQVSDYLFERARKEQIITWSQFAEICTAKFIPYNIPGGNPDAKLHAIALSLNEAGNIIYVDNTSEKHIILDPNWFCRDVLGSLIYFPEGKSDTMEIHGFTNRRFLEKKLERVDTDNRGIKGPLLVDLMEGMHLCCKVPGRALHPQIEDGSDHGLEEYFIPATLTEHTEARTSGDIGNAKLQPTNIRWRHDQPGAACTLMGRRLACKSNDLNILTPGLFPRIQVLFSNAFEKINGVEVELRKNFISILVLKSVEIMVVFCKAKADDVIDVLARAQQHNQEHEARALANVQEHIIDTIIKVCAQPKGIQGATLIEHVIRPYYVIDPSNARGREDQCVEMNHLKQLLRDHLEKGLPERYAWKQTVENDSPTTSTFLDLLGYKNYWDVIATYKAWLEEAMQSNCVDDDGSLEKGEPSSGSRQPHQRRHNIVSKQLSTLQEGNSLDEKIGSSMRGDQAVAVEEVEVVCTQNMANVVFKEILRLHDKVSDELAATERLDDMRKEVESMKGNVLRMFEELIVDKILKSSHHMDSKTDQMPVPRLVYFRTSGVHKLWDLVTVGNVKPVDLELCCEYWRWPHRVKGQPAMSLASLSVPLRKHLDTALPYINGVLWILTAAAKAGLNAIAPPAGSFIPDNTRLPDTKVSQQHPLIPGTTTSGNASTFVAHNTSEMYREWQKCFKAILIEKYGHDVNIEQKITDRFLLYPVDYKDGYGRDSHVAWLCPEHYKDHIGLRPA